MHAVAMSPAVAVPRVHSRSVPPIRTTGRMPASAINQKRKAAEVAPKLALITPKYALITLAFLIAGLATGALAASTL